MIAFIASFSRVVFRVIIIILGLFLILSGLSFITATVVGISGLSSFSFFDHGELINFSLPDLLNMVFSSDLMNWLAVISAILLFGIPLVMLVYLGFRMLLGNRVRIPYLSVTALSFWLAGLVIARIIAANTGMDFRHTGRITKTYEIKLPKDQILYFSADPNQKSLEHPGVFEIFDGEYRALTGEEGTMVFQVPAIEFRRSSTDKASVTLLAYAKGRTRQKADLRAESLEYSISSTDSSFILPDYYWLPANAVIRAQKVKLIIEIPEGQTVHFDENMKKLFDENPRWSIRNKDFEGRTWIMTSSGLKPQSEEAGHSHNLKDAGKIC